jgi:hypothetical protein
MLSPTYSAIRKTMYEYHVEIRFDDKDVKASKEAIKTINISSRC